MNESNSSSPHMPDEEVMRRYAETREHVVLPDDLPDDIRQKMESDPNPQTLHWVVDESRGDFPLLRLLLLRDAITQQLMNPHIDPSDVREQLQPIRDAIHERKTKLELYNDYRF